MTNKARFETLIRNILILLGFLFLRVLVGSYAIWWMGKIFFLDRTFRISSLFGTNVFTLCKTLPNILFFFLLGLLVPVVIRKDSMIWSTIIGFALLLYNRFMTMFGAGELPPTIYTHLVRYMPLAVIVPAFVLGSFLTYQLMRSKSNLLSNIGD
jgi:hypothetical protein